MLLSCINRPLTSGARRLVLVMIEEQTPQVTAL
jgi:hypothetical protein